MIVTGELERRHARRPSSDSLITKCPSKFADEAEENPDHVIIEE